MLRRAVHSLLERENRLLLASLVIGFVTISWHLFQYPLYLTDEGIYVQRAWSVLHQLSLSPYTYTYDHAPFGWLTLAGWAALLGQFHLFGDAINTGRMLMVPVHLASVYFLFEITRRFSGGNKLAAFLAATLFSVSPLGIFYERMMLLDNLMVFWILLSLYLITRGDDRITTALASGLAFGLAVLTKENAVFLLPVFVFVLYRRIKGRLNRRFASGFFFYALGAPVSLYLLYAILKGELLPAGWDFRLSKPPTGHVSLLYEIWYQAHRTQGSVLSGHGLFWQMLRSTWLPKDKFLLIGGAIATVIVLAKGLRDHRHNEAELAAGFMAACFGFYLMRGSVLLAFYVIPLVPLLALNIGLVLGRWLARLHSPTRGVAVLALAGALLSPMGGYLFVHGTKGQLQVADMYRLDLTAMQVKQLQWVETHVPKTARLIIDDDMWVPLHQVGYRFAESHYEASSDPAVEDRVFHQEWQNIDYVVMSNQMREAMVINNTNGGENWLLDAIDNHSQVVWDLKQGGIELQVLQMIGSGSQLVTG